MRKTVRGVILVFFLGIACMAHWEGRVSAMADPQSANSPQLLKFLTDQNGGWGAGWKTRISSLGFTRTLQYK